MGISRGIRLFSSSRCCRCLLVASFSFVPCGCLPAHCFLESEVFFDFYHFCFMLFRRWFVVCLVFVLVVGGVCLSSFFAFLFFVVFFELGCRQGGKGVEKWRPFLCFRGYGISLVFSLGFSVVFLVVFLFFPCFFVLLSLSPPGVHRESRGNHLLPPLNHLLPSTRDPRVPPRIWLILSPRRPKGNLRETQRKSKCSCLFFFVFFLGKS